MDLKTELQTDPLGLGYAGKTLGEIHGIINTKQYAVKKPIPLQRIVELMVKKGIFVKLHDAATDKADPGHAASINMLEALRNSLFGSVIDTEDTDVIALLTALQTGGVVTAGQNSAVSSMADVLVSRAEFLGLGPVSMRDINDALT